jgi:hypothetical protein
VKSSPSSLNSESLVEMRQRFAVTPMDPLRTSNVTGDDLVRKFLMATLAWSDAAARSEKSVSPKARGFGLASNVTLGSNKNSIGDPPPLEPFLLVVDLAGCTLPVA